MGDAPRFEEQHAEVADVINLAAKIGYKNLKSDLWILDREFERAGAELVGNTGLMFDVADLIDDPMDLWKEYQRVVGKLPEGFDPESPIRQLSLLLRVIEAGEDHGFRLPVDPWDADAPDVRESEMLRRGRSSPALASSSEEASTSVALS